MKSPTRYRSTARKETDKRVNLKTGGRKFLTPSVTVQFDESGKYLQVDT